MELERYPYFTNDFKDYVFFSEGPKGRIKKIIKFTKIQDFPDVYNLGFGDEQPGTEKINDWVVTNSEDRDIVLATVANTIIQFINHYGDYLIYIQGSTPARTRLYQMTISLCLDEVLVDFDLFGSKKGIFERFQKNVNYDAFLVKRKN
jgi:hypothetical protein